MAAAATTANLSQSSIPCPTLFVSTVPDFGLTLSTNETGRLAGSVSVPPGIDRSNLSVAAYFYTLNSAARETYSTYSGGWLNRPSEAQPTVPVRDGGEWEIDASGDPRATLLDLVLVPRSAQIPLSLNSRYSHEGLPALALARALVARGSDQLQWAGRVWAKKVADGRWFSTEVVLQDVLSYGTYLWWLEGPLPFNDPNVVLGLFFWEEERFGAAYDPIRNYRPAKLRVVMNATGDPAVRLTVKVVWTAGTALFRVYKGWHCTSNLLSTEVKPEPMFEGSLVAPFIPTPAKQRVRMNLWRYPAAEPRTSTSDIRNSRPSRLIYVEARISLDQCVYRGTAPAISSFAIPIDRVGPFPIFAGRLNVHMDCDCCEHIRIHLDSLRHLNNFASPYSSGEYRRTRTGVKLPVVDSAHRSSRVAIAPSLSFSRPS
eukprot:tig00021464_g21710.t1